MQENYWKINNNFCIDDDEYDFSICAELYQPQKDVAEQMIKDGKAYLIGDPDYDYKYYKIDISIFCKSIEPYGFYRIDGDIGEDEIINLHYVQTTRLNGSGISSSTGPLIPKDVWYMGIDSRKLIEKWLNQEFGKVLEWN